MGFGISVDAATFNFMFQEKQQTDVEPVELSCWCQLCVEWVISEPLGGGRETQRRILQAFAGIILACGWAA